MPRSSKSILSAVRSLDQFIDSKTLVIQGDARDTALLEDEGIKNTQAFVALTGNAETNILACLTAKRLGVRKTVVDVENIDYIDMAESPTSVPLLIRKPSPPAASTSSCSTPTS